METIKGKIKTILPTKEGVGKQSQKQWKSLTFVISNNDGYDGAEQIFAFDVNGFEKEDGTGFDLLENFLKYNKVDSEVEVSYNIRTNEWQNKFYTSLSAWKIMAVTTEQPKEESAFETVEDSDLLPF